MKNNNFIPKSFKLFATTVHVVFNDYRLSDLKAYGYWHPSESTVTLALKDGLTPIPDDKVMDTFYHEKVHAILDTMHEYELSNNEKFVTTFAKLLRQADETAEYS
jgi:hypothetical protein